MLVDTLLNAYQQIVENVTFQNFHKKHTSKHQVLSSSSIIDLEQKILKYKYQDQLITYAYTIDENIEVVDSKIIVQNYIGDYYKKFIVNYSFESKSVKVTFGIFTLIFKLAYQEIILRNDLDRSIQKIHSTEYQITPEVLLKIVDNNIQLTTDNKNIINIVMHDDGLITRIFDTVYSDGNSVFFITNKIDINQFEKFESILVDQICYNFNGFFDAFPVIEINKNENTLHITYDRQYKVSQISLTLDEPMFNITYEMDKKVIISISDKEYILHFFNNKFLITNTKFLKNTFNTFEDVVKHIYVNYDYYYNL
jgi:hypothetical protein